MCFLAAIAALYPRPMPLSAFLTRMLAQAVVPESCSGLPGAGSARARHPGHWLAGWVPRPHLGHPLRASARLGRVRVSVLAVLERASASTDSRVTCAVNKLTLARAHAVVVFGSGW